MGEISILHKIRIGFLIKAISLFLSINLLYSIVYPTVSLAVTGGPMAPEFASFEPVDATDMVDLSTGDFSYTLPIIEVPGPEGNYPIALSYHAGITPDQEASWVGLGWNINPGAITRYVNNIPDDIYNSGNLVSDVQNEGSTSNFSIGIGIGPVSAGVDFANDTYRGAGVGGSLGVGIGRVGLSVGLNPYGGGYASIGVTLGGGGASKGMGASLSVGVAWDESGKASAFASVGISAGAAGFSLSTSQAGTSYGISIAGVQVASGSLNNNVNSGAYTSFSAGGGMIPLWIPYTCFTLNIGWSSVRYYLDVQSWNNSFGSLYNNSIYDLSSQIDLNNVLADNVAIKDINSNELFECNPDKVMGGSVPAFDTYSVMAQGIGGTMKPVAVEAGSWARNSSVDVSPFKDFNNRATQGLGFRFDGDFSNKVSWEHLLNTTDVNSYKTLNSSLGDSNDGTYTYDNAPSSVLDKPKGMIASSKHVEWFTNEQIVASYTGRNDLNEEFNPNNANHKNYKNSSLYAKGFVPNLMSRVSVPNFPGYSMNLSKNIGGFMITNENGMTYHYTIPVYNFEEYQWIYQPTKAYKRTISKSTPYAYCWLLTGITGPDFVDRGVEGELDDQDFGYWVKFDYGLWTDHYQWRNPHSGSRKDINSEFRTFSSGKRQVYYLNSIRTRSHTALFIKSKRVDGKGLAKNGEYSDYYSRSSPDLNGEIVNNKVKCLAVSQLKLDKILLFTNKTLDEYVKSGSNFGKEWWQLKDGTNADLNLNVTYNSQNYRFHYPENVLDIYDISKYNATTTNYDDILSEKAIRNIKLNYDYTLCQGVDNSFKLTYSSYNSPSKNSNYYSESGSYLGSYGKLTLKSIDFFGYNSTNALPVKVLPKMEFEYKSPTETYLFGGVDIWGSYKSDFNTNTDIGNTQNWTTTASAVKADAWSLNKIKTSLGSEVSIDYESDTYTKIVHSPFRNWIIENIKLNGGVTQSNNLVKIKIKSQMLLNQINELKVNEEVKIHGIFFISERGNLTCTNHHDISGTVKSIDPNEDNTLIVESSGLLSLMKKINENTHQPELNKVFYGTGNLMAENDESIEKLGGGIRVKSINVKKDQQTNTTNYTYFNGTTAYLPMEVLLFICQNPNFAAGLWGNYFEAIKAYRNGILKKYKDIVACSYFLPNPGVIYEKVRVSDKVINSPNSGTGQGLQVEVNGQSYTDYEFQTYNPTMHPLASTDIERRDIVKTDYTNYVKGIKFKDFRNRVGLLTKVTHFKSDGTALMENTNTYLHDLGNAAFEAKLDANYRNMGKIDQVYLEKRFVISSGQDQLMVTKVESYPIIQTGSTTKDKRTNTQKTSKTLAYDFYTGKPTAYWTQDAFGNQFLQESTPAYKIYSAMGHKFNPSGGVYPKQMVGKTAESVSYYVTEAKSNPELVSDYTKVGVVAANSITYSKSIPVVPTSGLTSASQYNNFNIWRPLAQYNFIGDGSTTLLSNGTIEYADYSPYDFQPQSNNTKWEKVVENTKFNCYGAVIESKNLNNKYSCKLMDPKQQYLTANAVNAKYTEVGYSGVEFSDLDNSKENNVDFNDGGIYSNKRHTGGYSMVVLPTKKGFSYTIPTTGPKKWKASVWAYFQATETDAIKQNIKLELLDNTGSAVSNYSTALLNAPKAGGWYKLDLVVDLNTVSAGTYQIAVKNYNSGVSAYFDDFRVCPLGAQMVSNVYDVDRSLLIYTINDDNYFTRYQYDNKGNVERVYSELPGKETEVLNKIFKKNYGKQ